jgi:chromosome partitioning protein
MRLAAIESSRGGLADQEDRDQRLKAVLDGFDGRYEWAIIDCPPAIGLLTYNALRAADEALIPVETSFFAMRGAQRQVKTIKALARRLGGQTPYRLLATMHDNTNPLAMELLDELRHQFADRLIPHAIRLDSKLKEAATFGQPVVDYDESATGTQDHAALAQYLIDNPPARGVGRNSKPIVRPAPVFGTPRPEPGPKAQPSAAPAPASVTLQEPTMQTATAIAEPKPIQPNVTPSKPANDRGADLAQAARRLLERTAHIESQIRSDAETLEAIRSADDPVASGQHQGTLARLFGATETARGVLFVHPAPPSVDVHIAGDFNNWSLTATPLRYNESVGVHEACLRLPPGRCEYRLVINGRWMLDPYNRSTSPNPFGGENSVVVISRKRTLENFLCEGAD